MSPATLPQAPAVAPPLAAAPEAKRLDPRYLLAGLITLILVVGQFFFDALGGYERLATALGCALATEIVLSRLMRGVWPNVLSAYISGISATILLKPATDDLGLGGLGALWPYALGATISIASKYVLTYKGRHLWNPTNFGICALLLLAPQKIAILSTQWSNDWAPILIIWTIGLVVVRRARVLHVTLAYVVSFLALAPLRAWISGDPLLAELAPLTGPMYQLFIFFMITDPPTTVSSFRGRILVAVVIALAECAIRALNELDVPALHPLLRAAPLYSLWIIGPIANVIDRARPGWTPRRP